MSGYGGGDSPHSQTGYAENMMLYRCLYILGLASLRLLGSCGLKWRRPSGKECAFLKVLWRANAAPNEWIPTSKKSTFFKFLGQFFGAKTIKKPIQKLWTNGSPKKEPKERPELQMGAQMELKESLNHEKRGGQIETTSDRKRSQQVRFFGMENK